MAIQYQSRNETYKKPFGAVPENTDVCFRVVPKGLSYAQRAILTLQPDGSDAFTIEGERDHDGFSFRFRTWDQGLFFYKFAVWYQDNSEDETVWHQLTVFKEAYETPRWLAKGLMYQIFPDRFKRSQAYQPPNQKKDHILRDDWGGMPEAGPDENGIVWNKDFFGGNLQGITEELPYLEELGVTVIYLNPIFEAFSNHRYDTADYKKIDPMLGTEEDFVHLCEQAIKRGIRIVLDGVFNHTGSHSIYFNKDGYYDSLGAYQSKESPYYSWFTFIEYPHKYDAWWGVDTLPAVNETESDYVDYILRDEDSVVKHWLRLGASGFRLDVADELPDVFLDELRRTVKSVDPDAAVIGEVWEDASNKISYGHRRRYFQGDQLDTVMNYPVKEGIIDFVAVSKSGLRLKETVESLWENYPGPSFYTLMNILGTHDTERILTVMCHGGAYTETGRQRLFLAVLLWAFLPGIPCLYYGDELGMEGGRDPLNRGCFTMDNKKKDVAAFYRRVLAFRKKIPELHDAVYEAGDAGEGHFSFYRKGSDQRLFVFINSGHDEANVLPDLAEGETIQDFVNSGHLSYRGGSRFHVGGCSGIAFLISRENVVTT